jgi:hypothetical protein
LRFGLRLPALFEAGVIVAWASMLGVAMSRFAATE